MKRNKRRNMKRFLCFVVMTAMLSESSVQTVLAWPGSMQTTEQEAATKEMDDTTQKVEAQTTETVAEESTVEPEILDEIEENRGEFSKEYLLSDNSHAVVVYPEQIHYENEEGSLEEIDNSLIKTEEGYANANNSYDVLITDNEDSQGEVIYKENDYEIAWQMVEVETVAEEVEAESETETVTVTETETEFETGTEIETETATETEEDIQPDSTETGTEVIIEEIAAPQLDAEVTDCGPETAPAEEELEDIHQVKQSKITFDGYDNGVSVEYQPTGDGIKENIILPTRESGNEYIFSIQLKGLKARLGSANEVEFYDEKTDEIEYYFPAPFMIDSEGEISYAAKYKLVGVEEEQEDETKTEEETETQEETETEPEESEEETETPETEEETEESEAETEPESETQSEAESEPESETEETEPETESVSEEAEETPEEEETQPPETVTEADTALTVNTAALKENSIRTLAEETATASEEATETEAGSESRTEESSSLEETESETQTTEETEPATVEPESEPAEPDTAETETTEPDSIESSDVTTGSGTGSIEEIDLITPEDDNVYIKIVLDEEWLDQASYPVTVDPVLSRQGLRTFWITDALEATAKKSIPCMWEKMTKVYSAALSDLNFRKWKSRVSYQRLCCI